MSAAIDSVDLLEPIEGDVAEVQTLSPAELLELPAHEITVNLVQSSLSPLSDADAIDLCSKILLTCAIEEVAVAQGIIQLGRARAEGSIAKLQEEVRSRLDHGQHDEESPAWESVEEGNVVRVIEEALNVETDSDQPAIVRGYVKLNELNSRIETFNVLHPQPEAGPSRPPSATRGNVGAKVDQDEEEVELDDPWAEGGDEAEDADAEMPDLDDPWESGSVKSAKSAHSTKSVKSVVSIKSSASAVRRPPSRVASDLQPPVPLSRLLSQSLADTAHDLASTSSLAALTTVWERHTVALWPYRYAILDALPSWTNPVELKDSGLLPRVAGDDKEPPPPRLVFTTFDDILNSKYLLPNQPPNADLEEEPRLKTASEITEWYLQQVDRLDELGLLDLQLAWVQHGASLAVPGLDAIGEELSLLSRLVYDAHLTPTQQAEWSLSTWRGTSQEEAMKAYVANSTADSIVSDIRRLVLPYLYVLEAKAEREGQSHKDLVERHLHDIVLSLPLNLTLPIFEASKATLAQSERIVKNDVTVAKLALACLYGSTLRDEWTIMSKIFECLPVWDISDEVDANSDQELTSTTIESIAAFIRPTKASDSEGMVGPKDLFYFFQPLPFASLSRALDILDVHLESGEILSRWSILVQLRFLLQSCKNKGDQKELAEKLVRKQSSALSAGGQYSSGRSDRGYIENKWTDLWKDMKRLNGGSDSLLRGALGVLTTGEMMRIYLGGILSSGNFEVARRILKKLAADGIPDLLVDEVVLATSREFYDNADSGNLHTGNMKLAYDCLSVGTPTSVDIVREKEFIEATSRLATFSLSSQSGSGILTPIEIRHSKSRLDFVQSVLASSGDTYRHPELVFDLADKLGYKGDEVSKIRIHRMLSDASIRHGEHDLAQRHCDDMFELLQRVMRKPQSKSGKKKGYEDPSLVDPIEQAKEVVWKGLVELGKESEYPEIERKMILLGQAIELCPAQEIPGILLVWKKLEEGQIKLDQAAKRRRLTGKPGHPAKRDRTRGNDVGTGSYPASPVVGQEEERVLGSRTAARAARLAMGFAGDKLNLRGLASPHMGSPLAGQDDGSEGGRRNVIGTRGEQNAEKKTRPSDDGEATSRRSGESDRGFGAMFEGTGLGPGAVEAERVRQQARKALVRGVGWLLGADENELAGRE